LESLQYKTSEPSRWHRWALTLALIVILAVGLALRLYNINWDEGQHAHPDERWIVMVAPTIRFPERLGDLLNPRASPLNPLWNVGDNSPRNFAYGHLPLYILVVAASLVGKLAGLSALFQSSPATAQALASLARLGSYDQMNLLGRVLSALFDSGTVYLTFLIGRRVYGTRAGLLGAAFTAFATIHVQLSHFYAFDPVACFFIIFSLYGSLRVIQEGQTGDSVLAGAMAGLAVSSKANAFPVVLSVAVAHLVRAYRQSRKTGEEEGAASLPVSSRSQVSLLIYSGAAALLAFALTSPFALLDLKNFLNVIGEQGKMVRGINDWPFTRQYRGTIPYVYHIEQQLKYGLGWPLGLVAFTGFGLTLVRTALRRARGEEWVLLVWCVLYFLLTGGFVVKFPRYMLPLLPLFNLMGAHWLFALKDWLKERWIKRTKDRGEETTASYPLSFWGWLQIGGLADLLILVAFVGAVLYSVSFVVGVYGREHTWITASKWIYENVPDGSTIAVEHWDDELPKPLPQPWGHAQQHGYNHVRLGLYEEDNEAKFQLLKEQLRQADYIALASNRLYRSIPRLPPRYPMTIRYYQLLFSEQLGFKKVAEFTARPRLNGWERNDDNADESFTVYDHPKPIIFKKVRDLSDEEWNALLGGTWEGAIPGYTGQKGRPGEPKPVTKETVKKTLLLDQPVEQLPVVQDFRWNRLASENALLAILTWWLAVQVLGFLAWPLTYVAFNHFRDRGYVFSKAVGWLFVAYVNWLMASLHFLKNSLPAILLGILLLAGVAVALAVHWRPRPRLREEMAAFWRGHWRVILFNEALFSVAFLCFVVVRLFDPDLWQPWTGGEKHMEFAFLNAITRSPYFPPYDPYYAGGYINYYYYGQYLVAVLIKLTGIKASVAFNLVVPTLFALTVSFACGVVYNLARRRNAEGAWERAGEASWTDGIGAGLLAALFVAVLGNLQGFFQLVERLGDLGGSQFQSHIIGVQGLVRAVPGLMKVLQGARFPDFNYWDPTRVIPFTINEFPYFSFLFADLHPHMIGIPFTILVIALALNVVLGSRVEREATGLGSGYQAAWLTRSDFWGRWLADVVRFMVLPLALGALAVINTWDLPTYLGMIGLAFLIRWVVCQGWAGVVLAAVESGVVAVLSLALYWPFFAHYQAMHVGIGLVRSPTQVEPFLAVWGFFLFVLATFLFVALLTWPARTGVQRLVRLVLRCWDLLPRVVALHQVLVRRATPGYILALWGLAATLLLIPIAAVLKFWTLVFLIPLLIVAGLLLLREPVEPEQRFVVMLAFTGLAVLAGTEVVFLKDFLQGGDHYRMNTLFKFYIQVWVLFGLATAAGLPWVWRSLERWRPRGWAVAWSAAFALLLAASLVYPVLGTPARVSDRFPGARPPIGTLDGMAYMTVGLYNWPDPQHPIELRYTYEALQWLLENIQGTPVIAEGRIDYYREGGMRVASYTGLPTLLGAHQNEQRYDWQVGERDGQAREFYSTTSLERLKQLVDELHVRYIYVGELERTVYPPEGIAKFDRLAAEGYLKVVYENPMVKIYEVKG